MADWISQTRSLLPSFSSALDKFQQRTERNQFRLVRSVQAAGLGVESAACGEHDCPIEGGAPLLILDSSFNPPTLAHACLARASVAWKARRAQQTLTQPEPGRHDLLLLFSTRNADKSAAGTAETVHRLAMMHLLALEIASASHTGAPPESSSIRVLIGLTNEPFYTSKVMAISSLLARHQPASSPDLKFVIGFDTLVRFLDPKYYKESAKDPSRPLVALQHFFSRGGSLLVKDRQPQPGSASLQEDAGSLEDYLCQLQSQPTKGEEEVEGLAKEAYQNGFDPLWAQTRIHILSPDCRPPTVGPDLGWRVGISSSAVRRAVAELSGKLTPSPDLPPSWDGRLVEGSSGQPPLCSRAIATWVWQNQLYFKPAGDSA